MDIFQKAEALGRAAQYDLCGEACGTAAARVRDNLGRWIYPVALPDGTRVMLLKVLFTNACDNDCRYCANRAGRDTPRFTFECEELARLFDQLWRSKRVTGLFLSSAVRRGGTQTMERMITTVEILRNRYQFRGYIHLKILPGAEKACVERAVQLATRVSLNLEAPNSTRLAHLSGAKDFENDLLIPMRWVHEFRQRGLGAPAGQTTQFVVGAAGESDREILTTTDRLYREVELRRAYFSAFQPIPDTPLENQAATSLLREHRLYQSDYLRRLYGFEFDELIYDENGNLLQSEDPKMAWAHHNPQRFPIEINRASREELLRIPGIGPRSARRIIHLRKEAKFRYLEDLTKIGILANRAAPFILLDGRRPPYQMHLWDPLSL
ncbi:MAG: helix-hairpin-helix domain-containing protein [Chloroflexi bacterium]|nr:helix-hairpin-helix domain-containing protein [Chloroflexota bacterium]